MVKSNMIEFTKKKITNYQLNLHWLLIAGALLLAGCGPSMTDAEHIQQGKEYQSKSSWNAAIIEFKNALRQNPNNTEARFLLGETYLVIRQGENAEKELRHALKGNFPNELLPVYLGKALLYQNAFKKVLDEVSTSNDEPKEINAKLLAIRGDAFLGIGETESAHQAYQQALDQSEGLSEALLGLAKLEIRNNNRAEAKKQVDYAIKTNKTNWEAWLIKGNLAFNSADYIAAEQAFRTVSKDGDGTFWKLQGRLGLVKSLISQKQEDKALSEIEALLKEFPGHPVPKFFRAQIAYDRGEFDLAKEQLLQVVKLLPNHNPSLLLLGAIDLSKNNLEQAESYLSRFVATSPDHIPARKLLAEIQMKQGQPKLAAESLNHALQQAPKDRQLLAMVGQAQFAAGESEAAASIYRQLVEENPDSAVAWLHLGRIQLQQKSLSDARRSLNKALKIEPKLLSAASMLVRLELFENRPDAASAVVDKLKKSAPDMVAVNVLEGDLLMTLRKFSEAAKVFQKAFKKEKNGPLALKAFIALNQSSQQTRAIKLMTEWLKAAPDDMRGRFVLAGAYQKTGQYDLAQSHYEYILKANENNALVLNDFAWLLHEKGDVKALDYAEKAFKLQPENGAVMDTLGWILVQKGEIIRGEKILQQAVVLAPHIPDIRYHLAVALVKLGQTDDARKILKKLINSPSSRAFGDIDEAKALLEQL